MKKIYSKHDGKPWGTFKNGNEILLSMPLWMEIVNLGDSNELIQNVNISLYQKEKELGKMIQVTKLEQTDLGYNGQYTFIVKPGETRKYTLYFLVKKSEILTTFDKLVLTFQDKTNKVHKYILVKEIKDCWNMGYQTIEEWEQVLS